MRLGGRTQAAIDILQDVQNRHRPVADVLKNWGSSHRFAGSGDRAAIGNLVYDALRLKRSAQAMLGDDTPRAAIIGALLQSGLETPASLNAAFEGDRFAPEPLSPEECGHAAAFDIAALPQNITANVPDWCADQFQTAFGDKWVEEARALCQRPPLDLRANRLKVTRDEVATALASADAKACDIAPDGLRIPPIAGFSRHPNVQSEAAFEKGWFEVQDEGSQIVSLLAASGPAGQVLDYCAGAGGKTLALSAAHANKGQIFAHDAHRQRLAPIFERLKRAGCRNVQTLADESALTGLEGRMDMVLVDAPCTGSGTWRRRPGAKWRLTERQLADRKNEQASILDQAANYVRPGGRLVYITCSLFPDENDGQIASFLKRSPMFKPQDIGELWPAQLPGFPDRIITCGHGISLTPLRTGTDGFYFAAMIRQ